MKYYLGPYLWDAAPPFPSWRPPAGVLHSIDLRPIPAQETKLVVSGFGLFGMSDSAVLSKDYRLFGSGPGLTSIVPREADRSIFASMVGVPTVDGTTLAEWVYSLLTMHADVSGDTAVRPLMPTVERLLGACGIRKSFTIDMPEADKVIESLQAEYRQVRADALDGKLGVSVRGVFVPNTDFHREWLDHAGEKYNVDRPENVFIPGDLPTETRQKHSSTFPESFNKADSDTLGPDLSWTELDGDVDIVSNKARSISVSALFRARADSDLSSVDHYAQVVFDASDGSGTYPSVNCRMRSDATYTSYETLSDSDNILLLRKRVAGTPTDIASVANTAVITGATLKVQANGSTIKGYWNGVEKLSVTDTSITTGTRCGFAGFKFGSGYIQFDSFQAADLTADALRFASRFINQAVKRAAYW